MSMQNSVDSGLWAVVSKPYEERDYTAVILDGIQYLGDVIREKTGLASDGMSLVGEAFGGSKPKLRVNRLETETDKNVQGGIEHLVRGLYKAFRNPRSHEKHVDSQDDANTVLLVVGYLLKVIGQSKSPFERVVFLQRVFDAEFVESARYAELLAAEIPAKHRFDMLIEIYRQRSAGKTEKLMYMLTALWKSVSDESRADFASAISNDLNTLERDELIPIIKLLPVDVWPACHEAARIRIETILLSSIKDGLYDKEKKKCLAGVLGTWSSRFFVHSLLRTEFQDVIADKLLSGDDRSIDYVFQYVFSSLARSIEKPDWWLQSALEKGLEQGDIRFRDALRFVNYKCETSDDQETGEYRHPEWNKIFSRLLANFVSEIDDEIPF